jgi:hypothetical protein
MPKFVKISIIVCLSLAAVPVVPFGSFQLWLWLKTAQVERFYQEHRLLREMRAVQHESTNDAGPARDALLQMVPVGVSKEQALTVLRREGFACQTIAVPVTSTRLRQRLLEGGGSPISSNDNRSRKSWIDCQVGIPNVLGYNHWIVDMEFDADERLSDAGVAEWSIFL